MKNHNYLVLYFAMLNDGLLSFGKGSATLLSWQHDTWCNFHMRTGDLVCDCHPNLLVNGKRYKIPYKYKRLLRSHPTVQ